MGRSGIFDPRTEYARYVSYAVNAVKMYAFMGSISTGESSIPACGRGRSPVNVKLLRVACPLKQDA